MQRCKAELVGMIPLTHIRLTFFSGRKQRRGGAGKLIHGTRAMSPSQLACVDPHDTPCVLCGVTDLTMVREGKRYFCFKQRNCVKGDGRLGYLWCCEVA